MPAFRAQMAREAVTLYRELAAQRPDAFRPNLALSLNNLANMLSDLGQREPHRRSWSSSAAALTTAVTASAEIRAGSAFGRSPNQEH